jgi:hypothetical protein
MKILSEKQLSSGDWELECEFSQEELNMLLSYAVVDILKKHLKQDKKRSKKGKKSE